MTLFDRREKAFENMFVHEQEMGFKAKAHRNKTLAAWAAGLMTIADKERAHYQDSIAALAVSTGEDDAIVDRIRSDLDRAGHRYTTAQIRSQMDDFMTEAARAVRA